MAIIIALYLLHRTSTSTSPLLLVAATSDCWSASAFVNGANGTTSTTGRAGSCGAPPAAAPAAAWASAGSCSVSPLPPPRCLVRPHLGGPERGLVAHTLALDAEPPHLLPCPVGRAAPAPPPPLALHRRASPVQLAPSLSARTSACCRAASCAAEARIASSHSRARRGFDAVSTPPPPPPAT